MFQYFCLNFIEVIVVKCFNIFRGTFLCIPTFFYFPKGKIITKEREYSYKKKKLQFRILQIYKILQI